MQLGVGDEVILFADPSDGLWQRGASVNSSDGATCCGSPASSSSATRVWSTGSTTTGHTWRGSPSRRLPPAITMIDATGLLLTDQYQDFLRATVSVPLEFTWRYRIDRDLIDSEGAGRLAADLERFAPPGASVLTQLPELLIAHLDQRSLTVGLMSAIVSGVFASTAGGLAALAVLGAARHRSTTRRVLDRGASRRQAALDAVRTGVLVAVPAAAIGWAVATAALPDTGGGAPIWLAITAAATAVASITAATLHSARRRTTERADADRRPALRRVVAEVAIAVLAVGAVLLLRRRGGLSADAARDLDPLLRNGRRPRHSRRRAGDRPPRPNR